VLRAGSTLLTMNHSFLFTSVDIYKRTQYICKICVLFGDVFLSCLSSHVASVPPVIDEEEEEEVEVEEGGEEETAADGWPSRALSLLQQTSQYAISFQHCEWMWGTT